MSRRKRLAAVSRGEDHICFLFRNSLSFLFNYLQQPISSSSPDLKKQLKSDLPIPTLCSKLRRLGHSVSVSSDPGRFVCNFTYYHSLSSCVEEHERSIFVHCPPFESVPETRQLEFIRSLLLILASELCSKPQNQA